MKKQIFIILVLSIAIYCNTSCVQEKQRHKAQPAFITKTTTPSADTLDITSFYVKKQGGTNIKLGDTLPQVVTAFGQPDSVYNYYFEMDEKNANVYQYGHSRFNFLDNKLYSYAISDSTFLFSTSVSNATVKVGDNISSLLPLMPNYLSTKNENKIHAYFKYGTIIMDQFVYIVFDNNENITEVSIRSY